ncbi:transposase [Basilea psittacipulmonis]|uniref:transposase n=1 Tax=Basilea psittacipulmonis TaxID=1472345 RepID=UPI000987CD8A
MPQHFLLSSKAKTLSIRQVVNLTDKQAFNLLCDLREGSQNKVTCLKCGCIHQAYFITSRKQFRCKHCRHAFSPTSGTIFANHKLSIQTHDRRCVIC